MMAKSRRCKALRCLERNLLTLVTITSFEKILLAPREGRSRSNEISETLWQLATATGPDLSSTDALQAGIDSSQALPVWPFPRCQTSGASSEPLVMLPHLRDFMIDHWLECQSNESEESRAYLHSAISQACVQLALSSEAVLRSPSISNGPLVEDTQGPRHIHAPELPSVRSHYQGKPEEVDGVESLLPEPLHSHPGENPEPAVLRSSSGAKTLLEQYTKFSWRDDIPKRHVSHLLDQWVVGSDPQYFHWKGLSSKAGDDQTDFNQQKKEVAKPKTSTTLLGTKVYDHLQSSQKTSSSQMVPAVHSSQGALSQMPSQHLLSRTQSNFEVPPAFASQPSVVDGARNELPDRTLSKAKKIVKKPRPGFG